MENADPLLSGCVTDVDPAHADTAVLFVDPASPGAPGTLTTHGQVRFIDLSFTRDANGVLTVAPKAVEVAEAVVDPYRMTAEQNIRMDVFRSMAGNSGGLTTWNAAQTKELLEAARAIATGRTTPRVSSAVVEVARVEGEPAEIGSLMLALTSPDGQIADAVVQCGGTKTGTVEFRAALAAAFSTLAEDLLHTLTDKAFAAVKDAP